MKTMNKTLAQPRFFKGIFKKQIVFAFALFVTFAVSNLSAQTGTITGRLFDSQTGEALPFSTIALITELDSSLVTGVTTDENGQFLLANLQEGNYRLRITNVGYQPYISRTLELRKDNSYHNVGSILITPSSTRLAGVEIVAVRSVFEQQAGKLIFNVSQAITAIGDNVLETLKRIPGVTVDNDENISLNGSSGVLVMIDDRPTRLSGTQLANLLKSLPSSTVERIEVIDNPSARYDAEGVAGILNIKTKRVRMLGYSGSVFAGARYNKEFMHDQGFDFSFRNNNITLFGNLNHSTQRHPMGMHRYTIFPDGSRMETNMGDGETWALFGSGRNLHGRGGFDYYMNDRNILSLAYQINHNPFELSGDMRTRFFTPNDVVHSSQNQSSLLDQTRSNQTLSLNYQHIFDPKNRRQFFIDAAWLRSVSVADGFYDIANYIGNFDTQIEKTRQDLDLMLPSNIFSIKGDLEYPLNPQTKVETGVKYSFVNNDNYQKYLTDGVVIQNMTDHFIYSENIMAFYGMITHTFSPKLSVQAGLRGEHTATKGNNKIMDSIDKNSYFGLFPTLNINKKLTNMSGLNFSYSRRLSRPPYTMLNPVMTRNSVLEYHLGNPNLNPRYSHSMALTYTYRNMPVVRFNYQRTDGEFLRITNFHGDTAFVKPENIGASDRFSLNLMWQQTFFDKWQLRAFFNGTYMTSEVMYNNVPEKANIYMGSFQVSNNIIISPTMSVEVTGSAMLPGRGLFETYKGTYSANTGIRKSFFNRALTATLNVNDIFNTASMFRREVKFPTGEIHVMEAYSFGRSVSVRLSYRFGKGQVQTRRMRDAAMEENRRMSGGGENG